ncbi:MAG TPA: hypothetical protein VLJ88_05610 [Propionibacteriaceae bacterium]|nr:hypothetical protein [Propionibacteriaceae bacterium]
MSELQRQLERLREQLTGSSERIGAEIALLSEWAARLPVHHVPDPDPVRLADFAATDRDDPLSLAQRIIELARLLERADALARTLMDTVVDETGNFAPRSPSSERTSIDQQPPPFEPDEKTQPQIMLIAHCGSAWGDDDTFERQRQLVRQVMDFDGNRTWHGHLPASINDGLEGWQTALRAAEAGANVKVQPMARRSSGS